MKKFFLKNKLFFSLFFVVFYGCGAYFNQPLNTTKARIGENTSTATLIEGIEPANISIVGVYKFRDQTGQYKPVENGSTFSTAVTQGGTSILLKALEESKWFRPIERENIGNLLNERQIIRATRQEYAQQNNLEDQPLPPLLFADVILEGGIISYDSNIITGGSGVRYFGVGGSGQYREDRITVYLRAVSTTSGRILKNVYVSKTILSQGVSANLFRYVKLRRLLEVETGVTQNEPAQLAVKDAIDKSVELLIAEGIVDGIWSAEGGDTDIALVKERLDLEKEEAQSTALYNRKFEDRRGKNAFTMNLGASFISGDYSSSVGKGAGQLGYKVFFNNPALNMNFNVGYFELENKRNFSESFLGTDVNVQWDILPYENFTPFINAGFGGVMDSGFEGDFLLKFQYGVGVEYLPVNNIGISLSGSQHLFFNDKLDGLVRGNHNDYYWNVNLGVNFYFGRTFNKAKAAIFE